LLSPPSTPFDVLPNETLSGSWAFIFGVALFCQEKNVDISMGRDFSHGRARRFDSPDMTLAILARSSLVPKSTLTNPVIYAIFRFDRFAEYL
jgi:hypothetical protein